MSGATGTPPSTRAHAGDSGSAGWLAMAACAALGAAAGVLAGAQLQRGAQRREREGRAAAALLRGSDAVADAVTNAIINGPKGSSNVDGTGGTTASPGPADLLLDEQLSRGRVFLGDDAQARMEDTFVVVVGLGGVGSHCAHMLARSGVRRLRLIDFDNVTLSSLNRHAVAGRADVGTPKVAAMARGIARFAPHCEVEALNEMFVGAHAERLLLGAAGGRRPDLVIDCIDDSDTKVELISFCVEGGLRVLCSGAAGGKADPTRLAFCALRDAVQDPIAAKLRWLVTKSLADDPAALARFEGVELLYSCEPSVAKLLPLDAEVAGQPASELGAVANFRVRIMPVLGTTPASFGLALAARAVTNLAGKPFVAVAAPGESARSTHKLLARFARRVEALESRRGLRLPLGGLDEADVEAVMAQFARRCPVSGAKAAGKDAELCAWRHDRAVAPSNVVVCASEAVDKMEALLLAKRLPTARGLGIPHAVYADIVHRLDGLRSREDVLLEDSAQLAARFEAEKLRALAYLREAAEDDDEGPGASPKMCLVLLALEDDERLADVDAASVRLDMDRHGLAVRFALRSPGELPGELPGGPKEAALEASESEASAQLRVLLFPSRLVTAQDVVGTIPQLVLAGKELLCTLRE